MSNLGLHNIYRILNGERDIVCERAFLPDRLSEYERTETPVLSVESQRPLRDFDVLAFTIPFENDFENIGAILRLSGIPPSPSDRIGRFPRLAVGGPAASLNPAPFEDIFDLVSVSNAETDIWNAVGYDHPPLPLDVPARTAIWTNDTEFGSMHLVEMQRGCPHKCKFCAAPRIYRPFLQFKKDAIIEAIEPGLAHRRKIGLIGGDIFAHPSFEEIAEHIHSKGATFSPSSVRADRVTDNIARLLKQSAHRTITLAPETGSERLRRSIGKKISDATFLSAAETLARHGIVQLKLYFMIGLPDETDADLDAIVGLAKAFTKTGIRKLSLAINPFVPKRRTAFEDAPFAGERELKRKIALLKKEAARLKGVQVKFESPLTASKEYAFQEFGGHFT